MGRSVKTTEKVKIEPGSAVPCEQNALTEEKILNGSL